jgi:hypothetical protein
VYKRQFYRELLTVVTTYLTGRGVDVDADELHDLFRFQEAVMAHPDGPEEHGLALEYNWVDYFGGAFHLPGSELIREGMVYRVVDPHPCQGDPLKYLAGHFDVRGVPAFNELWDVDGNKVFPLLRLRDADVSEPRRAETGAAVS